MRIATLLLFACVACGGASGPASSTDLPVTVKSATGVLQIVVSDPSGSPAVGTDSVELAITRASDGSVVDGLDVAVVPWMPAMDHGTSKPTLTPEGGGKYLVSNLYFYMPGLWELKISFTGAVTDHAEPQFQVQ